MANGKGSKARPLSVDRETFSKRWDLTFKAPRLSEGEQRKIRLTFNKGKVHVVQVPEC